MKPIKFDESTISTIRAYAETHTKLECCNRFTLKPKTLGRVAKEHGISFVIKPKDEVMQEQTRKRKAIRHDDTYGDITEDGNGNLMCLKPEWYTGRKGCKYVFYHSIVMCEHLGITEIPEGFIVYHIDEDKHNCDISNLMLITISGKTRLQSIKLNELCAEIRGNRRGKT